MFAKDGGGNFSRQEQIRKWSIDGMCNGKNSKMFLIVYFHLRSSIT